MRLFVVITLSVVLCIKGVLPFVASASVLSMANTNQAQQDAVMICTGNSYRWVSLSEFYESGKLVDVETNKQSVPHFTCPLGAFDLFNDEDDGGFSYSIKLAFEASIHFYFNHYQSVQISIDRSVDTRGPPSSFI